MELVEYTYICSINGSLIYYLSRKTEGKGPLTSWQPTLCKVPIPSAIWWKDKLISIQTIGGKFNFYS